MTRALNAVLLLATLIGVGVLVRKQLALTDVLAQRDRLAARYGVLAVKDPGKYLITRVDTGDPTHFLWRCYVPSELRVQERETFGVGGSSEGSTWAADSGEFLYRCRFEFSDRGLYAHTMHRGSGGLMGGRYPKVADFVKSHWDELDVKALATSDALEVSTDRVLPLLTVRVPENLRSEISKTFGERIAKRFVDAPLFKCVQGTAEAFEAYDKTSAEELR